MEFDFTYLPANRRTALSISLAGVAFPFALGLALGRYMHPALGLAGSPLNFSLFMAAAMSITAIPVLGRILIELNLTRTRIGALTISAAAVDDASGWIILALVTAVVRSTFDPGRLFWMVGGVAAYAFFMMFVVRPLVARWAASQIEAHGPRLTLNAFAAILVMVFVSAAITNLIGIFSIFGGFAMGAILFDQKALKDAVSARLFDFVTVFFLPVFFTYTGLRTDIGTMVGWTLWGLCGLVLLAAIVGKFGGCTLAARWNGVSWRESCTIGIMMNTRGLMELIVINMGYDLGIIPRTVFFMLVVMAVVTTAVTTPALSVLIRKTEAEDAYRQSHFATSQRSFAA
jgi:Kef-type K+ transport system membrane component KefB